MPRLKIRRRRQFRYIFRATGPPSRMVARNVQLRQAHNLPNCAWSPI